MKRVVLALTLTVAVIGCGQISLKQKAVISLAASETALEAAHDAERLLCSPTSNQAAAITHCDSAQAAAVGLTDARHVTIAKAFSQAFIAQNKAAIALQVWRAGEPAPSSVDEYRTDIQQVLAVVSAAFPKSHNVVVKVSDAVNEAASVAAFIAGVK